VKYFLPNMKILFWFRKSEAKKHISSIDPDGSIQCRVTIDNLSTELGTTAIICKKSEWNAENHLLIGKSDKIVRHNRRIGEIAGNLSRLYDVLLTKYDFVTPQLVKEYYLSKKQIRYSISEITSAFMLHRDKEFSQKVITKSTYDVNNNYIRHILDYVATLGIDKPIQIQNTFVSDLFDFMIDEERSAERFARKVCAFVKQVLRWAIKKKMSPTISAVHETMPGTADSEDDLDTTHLSIIQINHLYKFDFFKIVEDGQITKETAETLSEERDAFVFNCFTGMHHCDYSRKEFRIEPFKGALFLKGKRKKTKKPFALKLLEPAVNIMKSYNNDLKQLPVKSNQKRNGTLKQVAVYAGIPLKLTTKIARKTFCDLALNEMLMSAEDVVACLGLTSTKYLKNYGRVREKRLMKIMKSWEVLSKAS
jgi:hypothetical protein